VVEVYGIEMLQLRHLVTSMLPFVCPRADHTSRSESLPSCSGPMKYETNHRRDFLKVARVTLDAFLTWGNVESPGLIYYLSSGMLHDQKKVKMLSKVCPAHNFKRKYLIFKSNFHVISFTW
jgi:hypothetical protein